MVMKAEYASIVRRFLSEVTQEHNPSLVWKAEKYSTGKFFKYHGYGTLDEAMDWIVEKNETYKDEIFFSVHSRKRLPKPVKGRKWEKQPARSLFVDIDCGNGKSFSTKEQGFAWAKHTWERLDVEPSFLMDSRSGYHLYWVFPEGITPKRWKEAQLHLAKEFRGDPKVSGPSQVMRLPGCFHYKGHWEGYFINLKESGNRFTQDVFFQKVGLLTDIEFQMYLFGVSDVVEKVKGKKMSPVEAFGPTPDPS